MKWLASLLLVVAFVSQTSAVDLGSIEPDLSTPRMETGSPAAGKRVRHQLPEFTGSELFHSLYLPTDWQPNKRFPVIFEYPGNGPFQNQLGDTNSGFLEDCNLGYGATAGKGFIWVCLPFVNSQKQHQRQWWGDPEATVDYCKKAVALVCDKFGGDRSQLILAGFSRGAIACNYIGLRDDEIASYWRAFLVHSHYDGVRKWPYADSDEASAKQRLARLKGRPQFISHEGDGITATKQFLESSGIQAPLTFVKLSFPNHTDSWVLRDIDERRQLRQWLTQVLSANVPATTLKTQARRPKVFLLGDSISLGYTPVVKKLLAEHADVDRPKENCQHSAYGLSKITSWLGKEKWDVIHFNWGIWDTHMIDATGALIRNETAHTGVKHIRHSPEKYRDNLSKIVAALEATGATLIWANTTPIMSRQGKRFEDIANYNRVAVELMRGKKIAINDLYEYSLPHVNTWQTGDKVHFNSVGNEQLGKQVSEVILKALKQRQTEAK